MTPSARTSSALACRYDTTSAALAGLQAQIGYTFRDAQLLETALTHASHANESKAYVVTNERMEFLGDAVTELSGRGAAVPRKGHGVRG
jgi:hypothetical protein